MFLTSTLLLISLLNPKGAKPNKSLISGNPRVVGGFSCLPSDYPFLVSIYIQGNELWCGGSLLSRSVVLTTAHCCTKRNLWIQAGAVHAKASLVQTSRVAKAVLHPNYTADKGVQDDVCVIQLKTPMEANSVVSYLRLANSSYFEQLIREQKCNYSLVLGFGYQGAKYIDNTPVNIDAPYNKKLQCLYMTPVTDEECTFFYPNAKNAFCAKDSRSMLQGDTCQGDSGGPVVCENIQIGLVTAGWGCGIGLPAAYTRVDKYLDFIYRISERSNQNINRLNGYLILIIPLIKIKL